MPNLTLPSFTVTFKPEGIHVTHTKTQAVFVLSLAEFERWLTSKLRGQI